MPVVRRASGLAPDPASGPFCLFLSWLVSARARKVARFLSQPFFVAEAIAQLQALERLRKKVKR